MTIKMKRSLYDLLVRIKFSPLTARNMRLRDEYFRLRSKGLCQYDSLLTLARKENRSVELMRKAVFNKDVRIILID